MTQAIAIYAEALFTSRNGKTAHGLIRYGDRPVVAVVDSTLAGRTTDEVIPFTGRPVPIVATVAEAAALGAQRLVIGVAPAGGKLPPAWKDALLDGLAAGLDAEAGLHDELRADLDLVAAARRHGRSLRDLRVPPPELSTPTGEGRRLPVAVVHSVGADCAIGKKVATLELTAAAKVDGRRAVFVPTGQTGVAIAGWGMAVDHVVADYVAGAAERLVLEGATRGDLLFVEGQGAIHHPAYSAVTLGLLHGCVPHALVLVHRHGQQEIDEWPGHRIDLGRTIDLYERLAAPMRPARVCAIALNTRTCASDQEAREAIAATAEATGRPCHDPVRFGAGPLWHAVRDELAACGAPGAAAARAAS